MSYIKRHIENVLEPVYKNLADGLMILDVEDEIQLYDSLFFNYCQQNSIRSAELLAASDYIYSAKKENLARMIAFHRVKETPGLDRKKCEQDILRDMSLSRMRNIATYHIQRFLGC